MTIVEITGGMLRAARSLTGLSQQEFADRASISRPCLTAWEGSIADEKRMQEAVGRFRNGPGAAIRPRPRPDLGARQSANL
jgi:transcriptional regulator with XRE-family HTH domain